RTVPTEDAEISAEIEKAFERRGIRVMTSTKADQSSLKKTEDGVTIKVEGQDSEETLEAEVLLVAVGRRTVVEALNLDATEVQLDDRGQIQVDEFYRTAEPGVYAAGDVIGGYWLPPPAAHEGIVAVEHMAGEDPRPIDQNLIPRVTFCRPEIASFGLTKQQAEEQGHQVKESKFPFRAIGKALIEGDTSTFGIDEDGAGCHDLLGTRCDPYVNQLLSDTAYDFHCHSNFVRAIAPFGLTEFDVHDVINVF